MKTRGKSAYKGFAGVAGKRGYPENANKLSIKRKFIPFAKTAKRKNAPKKASADFKMFFTMIFPL